MEITLKHKIIFFFIALFSTLLLFLYLSTNEKEDQFYKKNTFVSQSNSNWPPAILERNNDTPTENQINTKKTQAIAKAFYESNDLHAFAEMAKMRPEEGGITYAIDAMYHCNLVRTFQDIQADSINYAKSVAALNKLRERCKNFSDKDLSGEEMQKLAKLRRDKKDILLIAKDKFIGISPNNTQAPFSNEKRMQLLNQVAELQDPENFYTYGSTLTEFKNKDGNYGYWVDGQSYFTENKKELFKNAWFYASCEFGNDCTSNAFFLQRSCVIEGKCFDTFDDFFKQGEYGNNSKEYADFISVKDRIINAMKTRDFSTFFPPK